MTRMLVVPSLTLTPLSTEGPIPTDGQPEWWRCKTCGDRRHGDVPLGREWVCRYSTEGVPLGHSLAPDGPYPFTVAVWQKVAKPDVDQDEGDCIGDCGRRTNGWFAAGDWGPGWYCGWCEAVPAAVPLVGAVVATVEVTGKGHDPDAGPFPGPCITRDITDEYVPCHPDSLPDCWHTPTGQVSRLDVPTPMERPTAADEHRKHPRIQDPCGSKCRTPAPWWWADLTLEVPA